MNAAAVVDKPPARCCSSGSGPMNYSYHPTINRRLGSWLVDATLQTLCDMINLMTKKQDNRQHQQLNHPLSLAPSPLMPRPSHLQALIVIEAEDTSKCVSYCSRSSQVWNERTLYITWYTGAVFSPSPYFLDQALCINLPNGRPFSSPFFLDPGILNPGQGDLHQS